MCPEATRNNLALTHSQMARTLSLIKWGAEKKKEKKKIVFEKKARV